MECPTLPRKKVSGKEKRIKQLIKWLKHHYPTPQPTIVKWVDHLPLAPDEKVTYYTRIRGDYGICYRYTSGRCIILLSKRANTSSVAVETLLHEWVHALIKKPGHHSRFWIKYGKIYTHYYEQGGYEESVTF